MSSSKRRKLDAQVAPPTAVSAISALAARRRLAANPPVPQPSLSPEPEETISARPNSFNVLRNLDRNSESPKLKPSRKGSKLLNEPDTQSGSPTVYNGSTSTQKVSYSSFTLSKSNCRTTSKGVIQLRLKEGERFLVLGSYGIRVIAGEITIFGATLRQSDQIHWVHAAQCHAIPVLRTLENTSLELHDDHTSQGLRKLARLSPLFKKIWNEPCSTDEAKLGRGKTFSIIGTSDDAGKSTIQELSSPPEWNKKLASLVSLASDGHPCIFLMCGPKSAGKSTFSKMLTNRLVTSGQASQRTLRGVAMLDLDPGQPEYTPPGTISLVHVTQPNLSVSFTHPSLDDATYRVVRSHALASVSPASGPEHYLESTMDLVATYYKTLRNSVLLINTPGWILGTGLDLLVGMISSINPTEVIYMSEDGPTETVEGLRGAMRKTLTLLPSQPSEFASRTAMHLRTMSNMSYFHLMVNESLDIAARLQWNPSPLTTLPPWRVRYSGPQSGVLGIFSYDYQCPPGLLAESINGMIVAAVEIEDSKAFRNLIQDASSEVVTVDAMDAACDSCDPTSLVSRTPGGLPYIPNPNGVTLDPRYSRAFGLVLLRGIDTASSSFQVLTPIPPRRIQEIRAQGRHIVFVHGKFDAPSWAYTEDLYERSTQEEQNEESEKQLEHPSDDSSGDEGQTVDLVDAVAVSPSVSNPSASNPGNTAGTPWVEVLKGNEKRPIGSRVWRVRRDLGRNQGDQ